jgi:hypothetical protein
MAPGGWFVNGWLFRAWRGFFLQGGTLQQAFGLPGRNQSFGSEFRYDSCLSRASG